MDPNRLLEKSREVILDCCLGNGAVVAANTDHNKYPFDAKAYRFIWPRDSAFILAAADKLGLDNVHEDFFDWCLSRAFGIKEEGLFYENYSTNGVPNEQTGFRQLDQTGSMLWAISQHYNSTNPENDSVRELVELMGDGLYRIWDGEFFIEPYADLWEERIAYPELKQNHLYTLASCSCGLECASRMLDNKHWLTASMQMREQILSCEKLVRTRGLLFDARLDACLLGLCWPYGIIDASDERITQLTDSIENKLMADGWVHRYGFDRYDGWQAGFNTRYSGSGGWPLLNLWLCIVYVESGRKDSARQLFDFVTENTVDYLPEQVFENELKKSPKPLAWSHAMYVLAADKLSLL